MEQLAKGLYIDKKNGFDMKFFMNNQIQKNGYLNGAVDKALTLLDGYDVQGDIVFLPDLTDANSLPIGTTVCIGSNKPINPAFIGMDIGCGYHFFSAAMNPKRFFKKGRLKYNSVSNVVDAIDQSISSKKGKKNQLGTIGKGNHFIDMFVIDEVYDTKACEKWGLVGGKRVYFLIHSGSRDVGFQTHTRFSKSFKKASQNPEGFNEAYLRAFKKARNFAVENRERLKDFVRAGLYSVDGCKIPTHTFYDKTHSDIQMVQNGSTQYKLKKGTSTLKPEEMFVIPGTCTDFSYVVLGLPGLENSQNTINHGVGRKYTRAQTFSKFRRKKFGYMFRDIVLNVDSKQMIEEIPTAYKNIEDVVRSVEDSKLAKRIARLRPVGVIVDRD